MPSSRPCRASSTWRSAAALLTAVELLFAGCARPSAMAPPPGAPPTVAALRSPWDAATPVAVTPTPFDCGAPIPIAPDVLVTNNYDSKSHKLSDEVKQAVYAESDRALHDLSRRSVAAADAYRATGSQAAVQCVVSLLADAASQHAMAGFMASGDAWQEQNAALRAVAIAYLKVRPSGMLNPGESGLIEAWLRDIAHSEVDNVQRAPCGNKFCDLHGHKGLSVAMAADAVAVACNDYALLRFAEGEYRNAIRQVDPRGMLPFDTHGAYALNYNIVSAADLVQIAEFGETNGEPLYAYNGGRIHLLIHTVTRGLIDPAPYESAAGAAQKTKPTIEPWQVSWAAVYNRRFPDPLITSLLRQVGPAGADMWGGQPPQAS